MAAGAGGLNSLTTLIKRLEAATSRLEDIASSADPSVQPFDQAKEVPSTTQAPPSTNGIEASRPPSAEGIILPATVLAFDSILQDELKPFEKLSTDLGGIIAEQGAAFCVAFNAQRDVLLISSKAREPSTSSPVFMEILKDLQHGIETVNNVRENNRRCPQENHLAMLADGVGMLAWVTIKPAPDKYVAEVLGGAQIYGNKILTTYKDKEPQNVEWVRGFVKLAGALKTFIKQHYAAGLEWNSSGIDPEQALKEVAAGSAPASSQTSTASKGSAPPPPAPPPLPQFDSKAPTPPPPPPGQPKSAGSDLGAMFDQLNRGEAVTAGLRKVDKSQMTHKNPELRSSSTVGSSKAPTSTSTAKANATPSSKPPKKELDGNKWSIENYENTKTPIEINAERQQSILITRCNASTIRINGKANAVSVDNCNRLDIIVDSLVSSVSAVGTTNFRLQVLGTLPSVQLDKVDGATIYLSPDSLAAEVYTSKCSSINITLPPLREQDDSEEVPVPEQIRSWVENGKLMSEIVKQEG